MSNDRCDILRFFSFTSGDLLKVTQMCLRFFNYKVLVNRIQYFIYQQWKKLVKFMYLHSLCSDLQFTAA